MSRVGQVWERNKLCAPNHGIFVILSRCRTYQDSWRILWLDGPMTGNIDNVDEKVLEVSTWHMLDAGSLPKRKVR